MWVDQTVDIKGRKPVRGIGGATVSAGAPARYPVTSCDRAWRQDRVQQRNRPREDFSVRRRGGIKWGRSRLRRQRANEFNTKIVKGRNKYVWLGTTRVFNSFEFAFVPTDAGWISFHAYGFDQGTSTLIVECTETWATRVRISRGGKPCAPRGDFRRPPRGPQAAGADPRRSSSWLKFWEVTNDLVQQERSVAGGRRAYDPFLHWLGNAARDPGFDRPRQTSAQGAGCDVRFPCLSVGTQAGAHQAAERCPLEHALVRADCALYASRTAAIFDPDAWSPLAAGRDAAAADLLSAGRIDQEGIHPAHHAVDGRRPLPQVTPFQFDAVPPTNRADA